MNVIKALLATIDRPREAMQHVAAQPRSWLLAAILLMASLILLTAVSAPQQITQANERTQAVVEQMKATLSEEQARALEGRDMSMTPGRFWLTAVGLGVLLMVLGWLLRGAVLHFSSMALGGLSGWGSTFAVGVWSMLPFFVRDIVQAIYITTSKQLIEHQGIAFLVSSGNWLQDSRNLAYAALSNVDLFALWHIILLGIGVSVATKVSRTKGLVLAVIVWAVFLGLKLIPVAIGKAVGGGLAG
jgi:hypothetical protein